MTDLIGSVIGLVLIGFLLSPAILITYVFLNSKIDVDNDGVDDVPYRWENK